MQTLSSQPNINPLPIPQKSAAFFKNPLDRPEIGPSADYPLITPEPTIPAKSLQEKHLPSLWKPENSAETLHPQTDARQTARAQSPVVVQNKKTPIETSTRRRLPDEIKQIFETHSKDFASYAKNGKKNEGIAPSLDTLPNKMDAWDRALLFGEYPPVATTSPVIPPKRLSFSTSSSAVPKKTDTFQSHSVFSSRVMDEEVASPVPHAELRERIRPQAPILPTPSIQTKPPIAPTVPKKPQNIPTANPPQVRVPLFSETMSKKEVASTALSIPIKPKQPTVNIVPPGNPLPLPALTKTPETAKRVPQATKNTLGENTADRPITPTPNMSETLVEKIIEGQMRGVFDNAPPLLQKKLEKATMQEIFTATEEGAPRETIENEVWEKRLREYLTKLQEQAISVFPDVNMANPTEGESVLDYVKRVYPILLKAQVTKQ